MMKKWYFFVMISFCSQVCLGQTYSNIISDQEIINFMNEMLKLDDFENTNVEMKKLILSRIVNWQHSSFVQKTKNEATNTPEFMGSGYLFNTIDDSIITKGDINYFLEQNKYIKVKFWKNKLVNNQLVKKSNNDKIFKYSYSIPLFNLDKSKAVIYKGYIKNKLTRGFGYYLYHKVNGKWKLLKPILMMQS